MPYSPKFATLFRNNKQLSDAELMKLMDYLGNLPKGSPLTVSALRSVNGGTLSKSYFVLRELEKAGLCRQRKFECPNCGSSLELLESTHLDEELSCPECEFDIPLWDEPAFELVEGSDLEQYRKRAWEHGYELDAQSMARVWELQGQIAYLHVDLVSSTLVGAGHPLEFNDFISTLRRQIWPVVLSSISGDYLVLGEAGDSIRVAVKTVDQALVTLRKFIALLRKEDSPLSRHETWYQDEAGRRPRFSAIIGTLPLLSGPHGEAANVNKLLVRTLDRKWDINHPILSLYNRLEKVASPADTDIRRKSWCLSLLMTSDAVERIGDDVERQALSNSLITATVGARGTEMQEVRVAIVLFYQDSRCSLTIAEIPNSIM